jgi:hypothetical protein
MTCLEAGNPMTLLLSLALGVRSAMCGLVQPLGWHVRASRGDVRGYGRVILRK